MEPVGRDGSSPAGARPAGTWTLLTNHGAALAMVHDHPDARISDVASALGITERAAQRILSELAEEGFIDVRRVGRRNTYRVQPGMHLRHAYLRHVGIEPLLACLCERPPGTDADRRPVGAPPMSSS